MTARMREIALAMMRSATISQSMEEQQISLMAARMREMSVSNPASARRLTMCSYYDRPSGDCGYAEGEIELADGTRHRCSGSVIKGALNGFCVITIATEPEDRSPVEVSAMFNLGYAVGITYMQWPDGLLLQVTLEDSVLVTTGHDRFVFASFPSADPPFAFQRPSSNEFVVFIEPPVNMNALAASSGSGKMLDISRSCHFAQALKSHVISCFDNHNGKLDKSVIIVPEESTPWIDVVRKYSIRQTSVEVQEDSRIRGTHSGALPIMSASQIMSSGKSLSNEDHDFSLWCLILMQLESWTAHASKSREESKLDVGAANTVNEKNEAWTLFEYKMSDPSHSIIQKLTRSRTATNVYESNHAAAEEHFFDIKSAEQNVASAVKMTSATASKASTELPAYNLRCMPLFLRALNTFQSKHVMSQNIVLKGSGYRILIKAARGIKERFDNATTLSQRLAALKHRNETLPVLLRLLPHVLHQVQDENWASFSMALEFAWWLHEIAPVQLNFYGLHVLSCACVLGCRAFDKMTISQTFIDPKSFGRNGNQLRLSVGTLCLRAFQLLDLKGQDLKGQDSIHSLGKVDDDVGPLHSVIRREALPLAIRLLGANCHSQESIVSFSNILTDIKLNPTNFLGLAVNLINLLKSHQDSGSLFARADDDDQQQMSPSGIELRKHVQVVQYLRQHFYSCQNIVEVLLCLFRSDSRTFCTSDAAGGILAALQDMLRECAKIFQIYEWCQEHLVIFENEKTSEAEQGLRRVRSIRRREQTAAEDPAEYRLCAQGCSEVAQLITCEASRLMRLINSISHLSPQIVKDFFLEPEASPKSGASVYPSIVGIFCSLLSTLMRDANTFFRDLRLPENERIDVSRILKSIVSANFTCIVCMHHITSCFAISMNQMQVHDLSVCAFTAISSGVQFFSQPTKHRRVKKLAAFKEAIDLEGDGIIPLKTILETLIIFILLNLAHASHTDEVPLHISPENPALQMPSRQSRFGTPSAITNQHREILNQLMLWCVRGGGMVAAVAVLVASFAQPQLFLPFRLIVRVLLQKTSSVDEVALMSQCELEDVSTDVLARVRERNMPSVAFLQELVRWMDPQAAQMPSLSSQLQSRSSAHVEQSDPKPSFSASSSLFNINKLPHPLQRVCEDYVLQWCELVKMEKISDEFSKFFRDITEPDWTLNFQGCVSDAAVVRASPPEAGAAKGVAKKGLDLSATSGVRKHSNIQEVSRMLSSEFKIETTLAQRHLSQSMNAFHYFCGLNNVNGYIPYLMEMLPHMREATLPLLSKIPIPYKMEIVSPHLITGVARTLELEIAAFDVEKKDQVALGRFRVRRPLLWIKWMLWTSHLFSLGKFSSDSEHPKDLWSVYWAPWSKGKQKSSQTKKPWHYDKTDEACDNMTALMHLVHVRQLHRCCCPSSDISFLRFLSEPFFSDQDVKDLKRDLDHGSVKAITRRMTSASSDASSSVTPHIGFYQAVTFQATSERAGWVLSNTVELKPWVEENFTTFASAVGNSPLNSIVLHCFVDKKKELFGGAVTNKARRWLLLLWCPSNVKQVLFGDALEWFDPEEASKFAVAGFTDGRSKAKPNGKIDFSSQDVTTVSKGSGDRSFKISIAGKKAREFELLTKPTDFEQSDSLKLLLHGAFSKTHSVDAQRWIVELRKYYHAARNH